MIRESVRLIKILTQAEQTISRMASRFMLKREISAGQSGIERTSNRCFYILLCSIIAMSFSVVCHIPCSTIRENFIQMNKLTRPLWSFLLPFQDYILSNCMAACRISFLIHFQFVSFPLLYQSD